MKQYFKLEKETKNTLMFKSVSESENVALKQIYIQKSALKDIGYESGYGLEVEITTVKNQ